MTKLTALDINKVRTKFESWRAQRTGRERIPEQLWALAICLLDTYPFYKVRKELNLNTKQLKMRAEANGKSISRRSNVRKTAQQNSRSKPAFLELSPDSLIQTLPSLNNPQLINVSEQTCRVIIERVDGSRLSLSLPVEWNLIQSICQGFIKA